MATYYVNADTGLDTNSGLSAALAYKTINKAWGSNRTILIATGMCYDTINSQHFYSASGTPRDAVKISAYRAATSPNDDYPVVECGFFEDALASGWVYVSGGIWKKYFSNSQVYRIFAGAVGGGSVFSNVRSIGEALRRATMPALTSNPSEAQILAAVNAANPTFGGGAAVGYYLYMYVPVDVPPPLYYGGLYISGINLTTGKGAASGFDIINAQGIYASFLDIRGSYSTGISVRSGDGMSTGRDSLDILFSDMKMTACAKGALLTMKITATDPGWRSRSVRFERVEYDLKTNANEQEPDETYAYISGVSDAFYLGSGAVDCSMYRCRVKNAGHKAYLINDQGFGYDVSPQKCVMSYCTAEFDSWTTYANWVSIKSGDGHIAHHNTCTGSTTGPELCGGVHFYKNQSTGHRISTRKPDTSGRGIMVATGGADWANGLAGGLRYTNSSLINVVAEQNTIEGVFTHAFEYTLDDNTAIQNGQHALFPSNKCVIRDNVVKGTFAGDRNGGAGVYVYPRFLVVHDTYPTGFNYQIVTGNITNIPNPNSTDEVLTDYITDGGTGGPAGNGNFPTAINGMTGSTGNVTTDDLVVDSAMNPLPTSPLIGTATFIGYMPDIRGVQESNPPSKGARAYQAARTSRLT